MKSFIGIVIAVLSTLSAFGELRTWTSASGKTLEAEYVRTAFDSVVLKDAGGDERKILIADLSEEDRKMIMLLDPPEFSLDLLRSAKQVHVPRSPYHQQPAPMVLLYQFGARVKQVGTEDYPFPLTVEIYAFAKQCYDPDKYHLVSISRSKPFTLTKENKRRYEFESDKAVKLIRYQVFVDFLYWDQPGGEEFAESLIILRDERGEIVAYKTTAAWLYDNFGKLSKLPLGAWMNNTCKRVHPTPFKDVRSGNAPQF